MKWRRREWEEGVYSIATLSFTQIDTAITEIHLQQANVPKYDKYNNVGVIDSVRQGWIDMVFRRISMILGYVFQLEDEFDYACLFSLILPWRMLRGFFFPKRFSTTASFPFSQLCASLNTIRGTSLLTEKGQRFQSLFQSIQLYGIESMKCAAALLSGQVVPVCTFYLQIFNQKDEKINFRIADRLMIQCISDSFQLTEQRVKEMVKENGITFWVGLRIGGIPEACSALYSPKQTNSPFSIQDFYSLA